MEAKVLLLAMAFLCPVSIDSLYFHMNHGDKKCFTEEIPDDTLVIGKFKVEPWHEGIGGFISNAYGQGLQIEVTDPQRSTILSKLFSTEGRFAFTSHTPGDHHICLSSNTTSDNLIFETTPMPNSENQGYRNKRPLNDHIIHHRQRVVAEGELRVHLNLSVGRLAVDYDVVKQKEKLTSVQLSIRKLLDLGDQIVKEQEYQRVREDRFRQTSDSTNSRVFWFALIQFMILVGMGYWQITNLRMFFIMKKLV